MPAMTNPLISYRRLQFLAGRREVHEILPEFEDLKTICFQLLHELTGGGSDAQDDDPTPPGEPLERGVISAEATHIIPHTQSSTEVNPHIQTSSFDDPHTSSSVSDATVTHTIADEEPSEGSDTGEEVEK